MSIESELAVTPLADRFPVRLTGCQSAQEVFFYTTGNLLLSWNYMKVYCIVVEICLIH